MAAGMVHVQNLFWLVRQLNLRVNYKVYNFGDENEEGQDSKDFLIILHAQHDGVFKKYFKNATASDLPLFRGMFLKATLTRDLSRPLAARVQQAFLPKFENEGEDVHMADKIVSQSNENFMVVTIKHSGSLVTMSSDAFGGKNSVNNEFTKCGMIVFNEHFKRICGAEADDQMSELIRELEERGLALSFECCTSCLGHHGQVCAGDYLVTTSANFTDADGRVQFLTWLEFMRFCIKHRLPVNDTWLISGKEHAQHARVLLDDLAMSGAPTSDILSQLDSVVDASPDSIRLRGTYPHEQWQGSRIEGFVVAQGERISKELIRDLNELEGELNKTVIPITSVATPRLFRSRTGDQDFHSSLDELVSKCNPSLPNSNFSPVTKETKEKVISAILNVPMESLHVSGENGGPPVYSRAALSGRTRSGVLPVLDDTECAEIVGGLHAQDPIPDEVQNRVMQALAGNLSTATTLRYKKKMMLWGPQGVGYCLMTFGIRNGLGPLRSGEKSYIAYVEQLARTWGLGPRHREKLLSFGMAWARWTHSNDVDHSNYLDSAERFVDDFLAGRCAGGGGLREPDAFQGVIVLIGGSREFAGGLTSALRIGPARVPKNLNFSPSLVKEGTLIHLPFDNLIPLNQKFTKAAGPNLFCIYQPLEHPRVERSNPNEPFAYDVNPRSLDPQRKSQLGKWKGCYKGCFNAIKDQDGGSLVEARMIQIEEGTCFQDIADRIGVGAPLPKQDPGVVCAFVGIPGVGKSAIAQKLSLEDRPDVRLHVVSSDTMKNKKSNFWSVVGDQSMTFTGGSSANLVLADKNLVNSPSGNFNRVANVIRQSDVRSVAVLPTFYEISQPSSCKDLMDAEDDLVMALPLEMVALCMLRVLLRKNHDGGLDARLKNTMEIVVQFASSFCDISNEGLLKTLAKTFDHVIELPVIKNPRERNIPDCLEPILAHLAKALKLCQGFSNFGTDRPSWLGEAHALRVPKQSNNSEGGLSTALPSWEEEMRRLLNGDGVRDALESLQLPFDEIATDLKQKLVAVVDQAVEGVGLESSSAANMPTYIALTDFDEESIRKGAAKALPEGIEANMKMNLHVTLWHSSNGSRESLDKLTNLFVDRTIEFKVTHVDYSQQVSAMRVEIPDALALGIEQEYLHITLIVGEGFKPVDSNFLPARIADPSDEATGIPLAEPLHLVGKVLPVG
ncbi:hypothetical protein BSKO_11531 [Bryopsis sp. KO-2023]|nr:hypothetical protein BSKO_11531 [Bryopsis sp. KO-2023]